MVIDPGQAAIAEQQLAVDVPSEHFAREIAAADDPAARQKELEDMLAASQSPFPRAEGLSVHEIIDPRETRPKLIAWLENAQAAYRTQAPQPYLTTMRP